MSPCSSRTHAPSLRSMAGKRITTILAQPHSPARHRTHVWTTGVDRAAFRAPGAIEPKGASRLPLQEVGDQPQAQPLALLRVELRSDHGVTADDRGEGPAVVRFGDEIGSRGRLEVERMHEISVQALRPDGDALEQRMRPARIERVPAHMRDLQTWIRRLNTFDLARNPAQPRRHLVFAAAFRHELHADANAEERPAAPAYAVVERLHHAADGIEPAPAIGEGADARQHHPLGAGDLLGIARHHDRLRQSFLARGTLERFRRRMQIARAVIDDGHGHRGAPGCGNKPMTSDDGRRAIATPIAGEGARGAPSAADGSTQDLLIQVLLTQASKKRRSADSRSSPTTMPTFFQPRRDSLKRRNVAASKPTRSEKSAPAMIVTVVEAPIKRSATESAMARMT